MHMIAVHNFGRAILLWGPARRKKASKTSSGICCHAIALLDCVFPAMSKNLRVAVPVKTQVCLARCAVSNYYHKQVSKEVEGESKCVWCSSQCASHPLPAGSGNSSPHDVLLVGTQGVTAALLA